MNRMLVLVVSTSVVAALSVPGPVRADHPDATVTIGANTDTYTPKDLTVEVGTTVHWVKAAGSRSHNVQADGDSFSSGAPTTGSIDFTHKFDAPGEFPYHCSVHGADGGVGMSGTVFVTDGSDPGEPPAPIADAGGPYEVVEGDSVTLDGRGSRDPEEGGAIEAYAWDVDGDGNADATGATVVVPFPQEGIFTVTLTVTDDDDQDASDDATVTVTDGASLSRTAGDDRILTAVASARRGWSEAEHALLATGFAFPDALAATALAAKLDAPLLLTRKDELPNEVLQALSDLRVETVWILGGVAAVSQAVEDQLVESGFTVRRLEGADRFQTARAVALEVGASPAAEVVVALGQHDDPARDSWPDALSAGSLSAGPDRLPTLLTRSGSLPQVTEATLAQLDTRKVWLLGGTAAIADAVETRLRQLGYEVERLEGPSRYGTTVAVAQQALARLSAGDVPLVFATGADFPDGLTAGAYAARVGGVVVLVHPADLAGGATAVRDFIVDQASRFDVGTVIGGTAAVTADVFAELLDAMRR
ncbi:MAG: cell wall-binding repeat-containing protein [Actinobacteria bacterium]|nr:cell wall-binding repeat-containing protein [Actinomycetota bacterium]